jgi:hypothetical protein
MGLDGGACHTPASSLTELRRLDMDSVASVPTVRKTFKYELSPTPEQERLFDSTLILYPHPLPSRLQRCHR